MHNLRPYTIVHQSVSNEFKEFDQQNPNCVLIGDATDNFSYNNVDEAFRVLLDNPLLMTMGYGYLYFQNLCISLHGMIKLLMLIFSFFFD